MRVKYCWHYLPCMQTHAPLSEQMCFVYPLVLPSLFDTMGFFRINDFILEPLGFFRKSDLVLEPLGFFRDLVLEPLGFFLCDLIL